ncbi:MAG: transcription termination factor Rho [Phycisphaeraceae bacterium]|nr:transcription termination factor Rho [Phycisphaeraceae bacterium]
MSNVSGILELSSRADGRLRQLGDTYISDPADPVVPASMLEQYGLRPGVELVVELGRPMGGSDGSSKHHHNGGHSGGGQSWRSKGKKKKQKLNAIAPEARRVNKIFSVDGMAPEEFASVRKFEDLTSIDPQPRMTLEYPGCPAACRLIDLFCPIGYGQRAMIVSPPKAGKTTILQNIAQAVHRNHPDVVVIAILVDERPEEVTDFRRNIPGIVWASSNDHSPQQHVGMSMLASDRCKRMAEQGKDVLVLLDSLTRVGRAFNTAPQLQGTGRTLSGGLDAGALAIPKQIFGAARRFEEGGSLSIIATALVDTGSRGDQIIFEEFKGTGNMELILDRKIAEMRVFPAIDLAASGTRKEDKLMHPAELATMTALRRRLLNMQPTQQMEQLLKALERFKTNADLVGNPQSSENPQAARA